VSVRVRLHCKDCHADDPYSCAFEFERRGFGPDGPECYCPCHEFPECAECGGDADRELCFKCDGQGVDGHECGEDCCVCLDPEDNVPCDVCDGEGGWWYCVNKCAAIAATEQREVENG
jgi:hypothetical protein